MHVRGDEHDMTTPSRKLNCIVQLHPRDASMQVYVGLRY